LGRVAEIEELKKTRCNVRHGFGKIGQAGFRGLKHFGVSVAFRRGTFPLRQRRRRRRRLPVVSAVPVVSVVSVALVGGGGMAVVLLQRQQHHVCGTFNDVGHGIDRWHLVVTVVTKKAKEQRCPKVQSGFCIGNKKCNKSRQKALNKHWTSIEQSNKH
jgi:hypothetical protein